MNIKELLSKEEWAEWSRLQAKLVAPPIPMSTKQVAEDMGISEATVKKIISKAMLKVRRRYKNNGMDKEILELLKEEGIDDGLREELENLVEEKWYTQWDKEIDSEHYD